MRLGNIFLWFSLVCFSAACSPVTRELPLAANVVRIDVNAEGLIEVAQVDREVMRRSALATIQRGYTHFRLEQVQRQFGEAYSGATITRVGSSFFVNDISRPVNNVSVTVVMLRSNDAAASQALEARTVLSSLNR